MIKHQSTKTLKTKPNDNSANAIAPNLIYGCFGGCLDSYCYMARHNGSRVFVNHNVEEIFASVARWAETYRKVPDQQDPKWMMVDIACNSDLVLMQRHIPGGLRSYLKMYDDHPTVNSTMATKYPGLLTLDVRDFNKPPRVRVSLMPQVYSDVLEPKMQDIMSRIRDINRLMDLGWEVHINYSPVVVADNWGEEYLNLFHKVQLHSKPTKCEVIFMTNHEKQMAKATDKVKGLMKYAYELKDNRGVMRYPIENKREYVRWFKQAYSDFWPVNTIRYIF